MKTYIDKEDCSIILKKTLATAIKKLCELQEIKNQKSKKYQKIFEELTILNEIIESVNKYIDIID
jgi:hypothetical protein